MPNKLAALFTTAILGLSGSAFADGRWAEHHERRAEVNDRLANQNRRIDAGLRDGQLSRGQARQLHREDHAIRAEERAFASEHHGHITRGEDRLLNRQENQVSRRIYNERHE